MNFLENIRSCFWQSDEGERQHIQNTAVDEPVPIESTKDIAPKKQEQKIQELNEEIIEMIIPVMMMSKVFWSFLDQIVKSAKEFNVEFSLIDNLAYCKGKVKDVKKFEILLHGFHNTIVGGKGKRTIHNEDDSRMRPWEDRHFVIPQHWTREDEDVVLYKAKKKYLQFIYLNNVLKIRGFKIDLSVFSQWLEEFTINVNKQKQDFKEYLENLKLKTVTEKLPIYFDEVLQKQDILEKSSILQLECVFYEDTNDISLQISGRADRVSCLKTYLQAINPMFPKSFYPKYWDFSIQSDYAEIEVQPESEEFKGIQKCLCGTFESARLTKLKRIQNRGFMNNYLSMISSQNKKQIKEARKWLFYGTEIQEPMKIYKYSKTGFDLSYANTKGRFGKGLCFPTTALDAHRYAYRPNQKTFQVILADVFVGETLEYSITNQNLQKYSLLKGYDSLVDRNSFYVIYKDSQSYPLYLLEYTLQLADVVLTDQEFEDDFEDDFEEADKFFDLRYTKSFECPLELSTQAWDALKMKIEMLNLAFVTTNGSTIRVSGNESNIQTLSQWLNDFFSGLIMGENNFDEIFKKKNEKVAFSMLFNFSMGQIMMKATELEVDCSLSQNLEHMNLIGVPKNLESFKAYLHEINFQAKKYMFPKYWDFNIIHPYAEIEVSFGTEEFHEISKIFNYGFERAQVTHLTRIQNYDLWHNYISIIDSKTQVDPNGNIARKLLFHGTRLSDPKSIFRNSEIGFDLEFAKPYGKYGKGIYFSTNSSYSHLYAHSSGGTGRYQMLIADVYTGISFQKNQKTILNYPIQDHDSLFADEDNFFVLYNNFQSYPLYLVEYTLSDTGYPDQINQRKQKHITDILSGGQYCLVDSSSLRPGQQFDPKRLHRVQNEWEKAKEDEFIRVNFLIDKVEKSDYLEWLVSFKGFQDTPYEGGLFKIRVIFPVDYPIEPPRIKFLTQIYHPSINEEGIPCLGLISAWTPVTEIRHILLGISCLLHDPLMEEPLMIERLDLFQRDKNQYLKTARDWTQKYAN